MGILWNYSHKFRQKQLTSQSQAPLTAHRRKDWGLRDYGAGTDELGAEPTMEAYLDNTMKWVKEIYRVLKPTGSFVLNIGDCFIGSDGAGTTKTGIADGQKNSPSHFLDAHSLKLGGIYKAKQLLSVSSFAYCRVVSETNFVCRGEHIWAKPNVPSPIRSRLKHSHEKLFWFVKNADKYYFNEKPWMTKIKEQSKERYKKNTFVDGAHADNIGLSPTSCYRSGHRRMYLKHEETIEHSWRIVPVGAKQSGFELNGKIAAEHIAPFPENLVEPYIKSLCPPEGVVLDPFLGSGTTMRVAMESGRNAIGCELNEKYIAYAKKRLNWNAGLNVEYEDISLPATVTEIS
jgi:site-specific DNA-methyltransferase (adenine-specific)